jgi:hypothetical protein
VSATDVAESIIRLHGEDLKNKAADNDAHPARAAGLEPLGDELAVRRG